jgi:uncharacterized protein (TIGR02246 family)
MSSRMLVGWIVVLGSVVAGSVARGEEPEATPRSGAKIRAAKEVTGAEKAGAEKAKEGDARQSDLDAIRQSSREFVAAFNAADAGAIAELWTEDGQYIDEGGHAFSGRDAIEAEYENFFDEHPGTRIRVVIDSLRMLSDSAAIEDGRAVLEPIPMGAPGASNYTAIHVKIDGKWLMSSVRDVHVDTPSTYRNLEDLEWLVGTWTGEEHGASTKAVCRWVANKSFLQRTFEATNRDRTTTSGVQMIGWNAQGGHIQSWTFTSDGGHAVGVWMPKADGWLVHTRGMLPDGTITTAINSFTKLDDDAFAWQSIQRTAGGVNLPDTDEIVLKRQP